MQLRSQRENSKRLYVLARVHQETARNWRWTVTWHNILQTRCIPWHYLTGVCSVQVCRISYWTLMSNLQLLLSTMTWAVSLKFPMCDEARLTCTPKSQMNRNGSYVMDAKNHQINRKTPWKEIGAGTPSWGSCVWAELATWGFCPPLPANEPRESLHSV